MVISIRKILAIIIFFSLVLVSCGVDNSVNQSSVVTGAESGLHTDVEEEMHNRVEQSRTTEETKLTNRWKQLYETYIPSLDNMLEANTVRLENCKQYQESVGHNFLFRGGDYSGWLQADYDENGVAMIQMLIEEGQAGEQSDDRQKWVGKVLEDGSLWLSYQSTIEEQCDLPDYIVNESVLRYFRAAYVYDDGKTDVEQKKADKAKRINDALAEELSGTQSEFWMSGDVIYRIDRENQLCIDVTEDLGGVTASFMMQQVARVTGRLTGSEAAYAEVEKWKPEGYSQLGVWDIIAVSDLNKDGLYDYVAALYPNDFEEVRRYEAGSPYEHSSEYYAASFWLLLSGAGGTYEQIQLTDSIEYRQEDALTLVEVTFVENNLLQLEFFVGRSPWYNAVIQFEYEAENKDFHVYKSYFRESTDGETCKLLIGDKANYGNMSIYSYFAFSSPFYETDWEHAQDVELTDRVMLDYFSDSFLYGSVNILEERRVNSVIWEKEYEMVRILQEKYGDEKLEISLYGSALYYNKNMISGQVEGYGDVFIGQEEQNIRKFIHPIMIDKNTCEYIYVTECIDQNSFLQIYQNFVSEKRQKEVLDADVIEHFENAIVNDWNHADSMEHLLDSPEEMLCLQMTSEGVLMTTRGQDDSGVERLLIDKECFIGTDLWQYMKPEWM